MNNYIPKSHPNKYLIDHVKGILSKVDLDDLTLIATVFHDIGKLSENFQKRINGQIVDGYSHHSYISAYYLINAFYNNKSSLMKRFSFLTEDNYRIYLLIVLNNITGHHTCLRDVNDIFKSDEWNAMVEYLKTTNMTERVTDFLKENNVLGCELVFTNDLNKSDHYQSYGNLLYNDKWTDNSLNNYLDTIMTFSELINGDRRDASENNLIYRNECRSKYAYSLENNLEWIFNNFDSKTKLNTIRNRIREASVIKMREYLEDNDNRIFTLTAPTGSGKTLMMLQLAIEIFKKTGYIYDIIYSLPFLSIIDQTSKIVNKDLRISTLDYTSSSDASLKLQKMLDGEIEPGNILEYVYSENSFDHPFIITTFNQIFETYFSNSTSNLIKLKNFKKRIFLIDEFQSVSPSLYYTFMSILNSFCKRYDSYAIISTATMPDFNIDLDAIGNENVKALFKTNFLPKELLPNKIFNYDVFNRYNINFMGEVNTEILHDMVNTSTKSTLLIVNTIRTSELMHHIFSQEQNFDKVYLINSDISPRDRQRILANIKQDLNTLKILVVSTQVIEAGVDISFPVLYRDAAPPSSVVQSNGRGNRSGEFGIINSFLFLYKNDRGRYDCDEVYKGLVPFNLKNDIKNKIAPLSEIDFHGKCVGYFKGLSRNSEQGVVSESQNIVDDILNGDFYKLGRFRFIQEDDNVKTIYVGGDDKLWEEFKRMYNDMSKSSTYSERNLMNIQFKRLKGIIMSNSINIRSNVFNTLWVEENEVFGIYRLLDTKRYDPNIGLKKY